MQHNIEYGKEIPRLTEIKNRCPFVLEPFEDCYCNDMRSLNVERAIYYCGGNFEECEIYKERSPTLPPYPR